MTKLDEWLVRQVPPFVVWLLALLGWGGFLFFTPARLKDLHAKQLTLAAQVATRDSLYDRRLAALERVSLNLVKRACWDSDANWRLWLECGAVLGNSLPGTRP